MAERHHADLLARRAEERRVPPWQLTPDEEANAKLLVEASGEVALIFVTPTQIEKSIMDANASVRTLFDQAGFHSYDAQGKGPSNKVLRDAVIAHNDGTFESRVALYRPETKDGDPRLWIRGSRQFLNAYEVLGLFIIRDAMFAVNLSRSDLCRGGAPELRGILEASSLDRARVADELLEKLRYLAANGPHPAQGHGDTAVGRTLEHLLGIKANSSKAPDYKGIELKSARSLRRGGRPRSNLFAQVPDWGASPFKSSEQIVRRFGYKRPGRDDELLRLYCTLCVGKPNGQDLLLRLNSNEARLEEVHAVGARRDLVVVWPLRDLHRSLTTKHAATFWIDVDHMRAPDGNKELFQFKSATYTTAPSTAMFDAQLAAGNVTVDHLIKLKVGAKGIPGAQEKGPLFKVSKRALRLLFPSEAPIEWDLLG